nr:MAG TPA: hypothetical protein [Caudoviricetes sp.]
MDLKLRDYIYLLSQERLKHEQRFQMHIHKE